MATTYNDWRDNLTYVFTYSAALGWSGNLAASTAFDLYPDAFAVNDCVYFGMYRDYGMFRNLQLNIGTAMAAGSWTITWEYYRQGLGWVAFAVTDNTNKFQNIGQNTVTWAIDEANMYYWAATSVNGSSAATFWVRARVSAVVGPVEGGRTQTQKIKGGNCIITVDDNETPASLYAKDVAGGWGVIERFNVYATVTNNVWAYKCNADVKVNSGKSFTIADGKYFEQYCPFYYWGWSIGGVDGTAVIQVGNAGIPATKGAFWQSNSAFGLRLSDADLPVSGDFRFYASVIQQNVRPIGSFANFTLDGARIDAGLQTFRGTLSINNSGCRGGGNIYWFANPNAENLEYIGGTHQIRTDCLFYKSKFYTLNFYVTQNNTTLELRDCQMTNVTYNTLGSTTRRILATHLIDLTIIDKDGNPVSGATITYENADHIGEWSANTGVNGKLAVPKVGVEWMQSNNVLTTPAWHKITISKAGYDTVVVNFLSFTEELVGSAFPLFSPDLTPPTWDGAVGITSIVSSPRRFIRITWGSASDPTTPVLYKIYIKKGSAVGLFSSDNFLCYIGDELYLDIYTEADQKTRLDKDAVYYIGVRAVDGNFNETTNNNYLSAKAIGNLDTYVPIDMPLEVREVVEEPKEISEEIAKGKEVIEESNGEEVVDKVEEGGKVIDQIDKGKDIIEKI